LLDNDGDDVFAADVIGVGGVENDVDDDEDIGVTTGLDADDGDDGEAVERMALSCGVGALEEDFEAA